MRRVRGLVVLISALALLGLAAAPAQALDPFPPHDDGVRLYLDMPDPSCGLGLIDPGDVAFLYEGVPATGATYQTWFYRDGRLVREYPEQYLGVSGSGSFPPAGLFYFNVAGYPAQVSLQARIFVDGELTYQGGSVITCWSPGATPAVGEAQWFSPPCGREGVPAFPDVPASSPFCHDVHWAHESDITGGYSDGGYHPAAPVTRQAMAAFLHRAAGFPPLPFCIGWPFLDVPAGHPFCTEILWLSEEGISTGYADGTFRPGAAVTRQAMAAFLYRAEGEPRGADPACTTPPFPDVPTSHPFCGEIDWLADVGVTGGYGDGGYHPAAPVSRQAMAAFLHRLDGLV